MPALAALGHVVEVRPCSAAPASRGACAWWPARRSGSPRRSPRCRCGRSPRSSRRAAQARTRSRSSPSSARCSMAQWRSLGRRPGELEHVVELLPVAPLPPHVVVAVLAPAPGVDADGLDVAPGVDADPHVGPRRGDDERLGPVEHLRVGDAGARRVEVHEARDPTLRRRMPGAEQSTRRSAREPRRRVLPSAVRRATAGVSRPRRPGTRAVCPSPIRTPRSTSRHRPAARPASRCPSRRRRSRPSPTPSRSDDPDHRTERRRHLRRPREGQRRRPRT